MPVSPKSATNVTKALFRRLLKNKRFSLVLVILAFTIIGLVGLLLTKAVGNGRSLQPEDGAITGPAVRLVNGSTSGGHYIRFGADTNLPVITALTVVGTDKVAGNALCFDSSLANKTGCLQANPTNVSQARFGIYDIINKTFTAKTGWLSFVDQPFGTILHAYNCSGGGRFYGYGPMVNGVGKTYYGQTVSGATVAYGSIDGTTHVCTNDPAGPINSSQWATPAIICSNNADVVRVSSADQLVGAIVNHPPGTEICLEPGGHYMLSSTLRPKTDMKIIGDPFNRTILDAVNLSPANKTTSSIESDNLNTGVTIANVVVQNSTTPGNTICPNCGIGINSGQGYHVYNVKMTHNQLNGFHYANANNVGGFVVENSELSYNGNTQDSGVKSYTSGGAKTISAGTYRNNVVANNIGAGIWCDVECNGGQWLVDNNYVTSNTKAGIHYEISGAVANDNGLITNNVVISNNALGLTYYGGIMIINSQNAVAKNNTLLDNGWSGISAYQSSRRTPSLAGVIIQDNSLNGQLLFGCEQTGVTCTNNH